jgi:hypothetical protein
MAYHPGVGLGPTIPEWAALEDALRTLPYGTEARNAFIVDQGSRLWCRAFPMPRSDYAVAVRQARDALARLDKPLRRGGMLERALPDDDAHPTCLRSYAQLYVLVLSFAGPFPVLSVRGQVNTALPTLEELTLALPPSDGPTAGEGIAAKNKA